MATPKPYIPRINPSCNIRGLAISPHEAYVLSRIDGYSSANEIGLITGLGEGVYPLLIKLFSAGALLEAPPGTPPPPEPEREEPSRPPPRSSQAPLRVNSQAPPRYTQAELDEEADIEVERRRRILEFYYALDDLSLYEVLGVDEKADKKAIKKAYYDLAQEFHTDRYFRKEIGSFKPKLEAIFKRVTEAHDTLTRNQTRSEYDAELTRRPRKAPSFSPLRLPPTDSSNLPISKLPSTPPPPPGRTTPLPPQITPLSAPKIASSSPSPGAASTPPFGAASTPSFGAASTPSPGAVSVPPPSGPAPRPSPKTAIPPPAPAASPSLPPSSSAIPAATPARPPQGSMPPAARPISSPTNSPSMPPESEELRKKALAARLSGRWSAPPPAATRTDRVSTQPPTAEEAANARETLRRMAASKQIEQQQSQVERYVAVAEDCERRADPVGAANAYRLALSLDPQNEQLKALTQQWVARAAASLVEHNAHLGDTEAERGRWVEAARAYTRAAQGRPDDPLLLDKTANALVRSGGDLHLAADLARRAIALRPAVVSHRATLIEVYVAAGLTLNARRELAEALKTATDDKRIKALQKKLE